MGPKEVGKKNHAQGYLLNRKIWKWLLTHKFLKLVTAENYKVYLRALTPYIHFFFPFCHAHPLLAALQDRILAYPWSDPFFCHLFLTQPKSIDHV